jgi:UDP-N-acetylglucosamine 4,6-dehydratase
VSFVLSSLELMNGGEIFVPKIPSMRITDLARTIAPNLPQDVVGIRPGEKLHEIMITEDDARLTLEIDDRYIICPPQLDWRRGHLEKVGAKPVPEGFHYSSDINTEWLDGPTLNGMIGKAA